KQPKASIFVPFSLYLSVNMETKDIINITAQQTSAIYNWTFNSIQNVGLSDRYAHIVTSASLLITTFLVLYVIHFIISAIFNSVLTKIIKKTKTTWDDFLLKNKVLNKLSQLILVIIAQQIIPFIFVGFPNFTAGLNKFLSVIVIF